MNYQTEMPPGPELDAAVARVMGVPPGKAYSTDEAAALEAWEWLEKSNPLADVYLMRGRAYVSMGGESIDRDYFINGRKGRQGFYVQGETYPHTIALAVVVISESQNEPAA